MRVWLDDKEITGLCTRTVIDKSIDGAGAEGEVTLVCAPMDSRLPRLDPACGQWVSLREEGETLFSGRVERVSYDAAALSLTLLCFDPASRRFTRPGGPEKRYGWEPEPLGFTELAGEQTAMPF